MNFFLLFKSTIAVLNKQSKMAEAADLYAGLVPVPFQSSVLAAQAVMGVI